MATIKVTGMSCEHCVGRVTKALENLPGISNVKIDLKSGEVTFDQAGAAATTDDIAQAVEKAGYQVEKIE